MRDFSLDGKVIFVTGGLGLIGREVCAAFAEYGASVSIADKCEPESLTDFALSLEQQYKTTCLGLRTDIAEENSVTRAVSEVVSTFGRIDVLVHLAAIDAKFDDRVGDVPRASFEDFPAEIWRRSVDTNVTGTFFVTKHVGRQMVAQGSGNLILVGSTYSLVSPNQDLYKDREGRQEAFKPIDYVGTKSMIPNYVRYLATYFGRHGIRANCLVPHGVWNEHPDSFVERFAGYSPMARMCRKEELRAPFVFLASDGSSYVNGATLVVDGGWTAW